MATLAVGLGGAGGGLLSAQGLLRMGILGASIAGSFLGNKKSENATKLNDLKVSSSAYGQGQGIVYGTMRVTGNMFWATDFDEEKHYYKKGGKKDVTSKKKGSKKGDEVYEYYANFAMGLCEGPVKEVLRIWADSNLIYDKYGVDEEDVVLIGFSQDGGSSAKGGKSGKGKGGQGGDSGRFRFRFYNGSEDQQADPFMISRQGASKVPAHRGLCYLFFEHFALADFGNRTPTITAEISVESERRVYSNQVVPLEYQGKTGYVDINYPVVDQAGDYWYVDVVSKRLYAYAGDGVTRVFNVNGLKEINRFHKDEISLTNVSRVWSVNNIISGYESYISGADLSSRPIGVTALGDLVYTLAGSNNSLPVVFVDPISLVPKAQWGSFGSNTGVQTNALYRPAEVQGFTAVDVLTGTPRYITALIGDRGDVVYFDDEYTLIGIWSNPYKSYTDNITFTFLPTITTGGQTFYLYVGETTLKEYQIYLYEGNEYGPYSLLNPIPSLGVDLSDLELRLVYDRQLDPYKAESAVTGYQTYVLGAEALGIIESVASSHDSYKGTYAIKIDANTREVVWRKKISDEQSVPDYLLPIQTGNKVVWIDNGQIYEVDFASDTVNKYYVPGSSNIINEHPGIYYSAVGGILSYIDGSVYDDHGFVYIDKKQQYPASLHGILIDLCLRLGFDIDRIDLTDLTDEAISGYIIENPTSARQIIDQLSNVFFFDTVESEYKIKFVSRAASGSFTPDFSISQSKLGIVEEIGGGLEFLKETRSQEIDLPQTVNLTFIDPKNKYNTNNVHVRRPNSPLQTMHTREKVDINLPMALKVDQAKTIAHRILYGSWSERVIYDFKLSWEYLAYDPTDIIEVTLDSGLVFTARMAQADLGANYEIDAIAFSHMDGVYKAEATGAAAGGVIYSEKVFPPSVRILAWDIPYITIEDVDSGVRPEVYYGVGAMGPGFKYAALASRIDDEEDGKSAGSTGYDIPWGTTAGVIPPPPSGTCQVTDTETEIVLVPAFDFELNNGMYEWASIPEEDWPNDNTDNVLIIGNEIIKFRDVNDTGDGKITISHLIRGDRGTEEAAFHHRSGEYWAIPTNGAMKDEVRSLSDAGHTITYSGTSAGGLFSANFSYSLDFKGKTLYPWAPCGIKRTDDGSGNSVITWNRRTRLGGELKDGTGTIPLGEESEEYQVFILASAYDQDTFDPGDASTYVRVYEDLTSPTVTYTSAEKATDGVANDDPIYIVVYQISAYIGRGFPGFTTLNLYAV